MCPSCGSLVGVRDEKCLSCGRANPGLWGFAPVLRKLGADLGFVPLENLVGRADIRFISLEAGAHLWEVWRWPWTLRVSRFFGPIR